jgi:eukaryotic translation initiation factor 2C
LQKPAIRRQDIANKKKDLKHEHDPILKAYGISISPKMAEITARRIPLPQLAFSRNVNVPVTNGEWAGRSVVFKQVHPLHVFANWKGVTLKNWGVLIFGRRNEIDRDLNGFIRTLCQTADEKGVQITQRDPMKRYADINWSPDELTRRLQQEIMPSFNQHSPIELLLFVTPSRTSIVYSPIKRYCDTVAGIASQCLVKFNVKRKSQDRGFAFNMLMKINSKLGGVNVTLREMPQVVKTGTVYILISKSF